MQSNRNTDCAAAVTRAASKSKNAHLPPRPPPKGNPSSSDADAAARRAQWSELLSKLRRKQESVSRPTKRHASSVASSTTEGSNTIVTRARAKQQERKNAKHASGGSYVEMSPAAFHDYDTGPRSSTCQ